MKRIFLSIILLSLLLTLASCSMEQPKYTLTAQGTLTNVEFFIYKGNYQGFTFDNTHKIFRHIGVYPFNNLHIGNFYSFYTVTDGLGYDGSEFFIDSKGNLIRNKSAFRFDRSLLPVVEEQIKEF